LRPRSPSSPRKSLKWPSIWLLPFILTFAGCAGLKPDAPQQTSPCNAPLNLLEPTQQPPLKDGTLNDLLQENKEVRTALDTANEDKATVKQYILTRCK
jgi:hypothetical protein